MTLIPPNPPVPLLLIHAAAAVAVHDGLTGSLELDAALRRLFDVEERSWQDGPITAGLPALSQPVVRSAVAAGVLLGAQASTTPSRSCVSFPA